MVESTNVIFHLRFVVILVDTNLVTKEVHKTELRFFDEFSDACQWIKVHGALYGKSSSDSESINRYFRIEKRYYII